MARNKFVNKMMSFFGIEEPADDYDYEPDVDQGGSLYGASAPAPSQEEPDFSYTSEKKGGGKVVNHPSLTFGTEQNKAQGNHCTMICYMRDFSECQRVIDDLLSGKSVLLNLEEMDAPTSQRIIDMLSGAAYAMRAVIKKTAQSSYILAPYSVDVVNMDEQPRNNSAAGNYFANRR